MTLKEFMQQNNLTIMDLVKNTHYSYIRLNNIVEKNYKTSIHERNNILKAILKFNLNPLPIIFRK